MYIHTYIYIYIYVIILTFVDPSRSPPSPSRQPSAIRPCTHALLHFCTFAPLRPCVHASMDPCTLASMHHCIRTSTHPSHLYSHRRSKATHRPGLPLPAAPGQYQSPGRAAWALLPGCMLYMKQLELQVPIHLEHATHQLDAISLLCQFYLRCH